jgi:2,3,4,5-tetrahydropyridine-2-carboxylate N-succinyltransferase
MSDLAKTIDDAFEKRNDVSPATKGAVRDAVDSALDLLDKGEARVAEKQNGKWQVNQWLKKAVLLSFRLNDMGPIAGAAGGASWWDKVPSKFEGWGENRFRAAGFRAVPGSVVRRSAYIAPNVVLMPSFVNLGAYVDSGTMVDTWATVGSCAQIGKNVHISGGAGIGGVLEPLQAGPVIIEDNVRKWLRASSCAKARCSRWACSSVPRPRSSTARPARSSWAKCRPIPSSCRARCPASR